MTGFRVSIIRIFMTLLLVVTGVPGQLAVAVVKSPNGLGAATNWHADPGPHHGRLEPTNIALPHREPSANSAPLAVAGAEAALAGATYSAPTTPQRMTPGQEYTVPFTLANTTSAVWPKSDYVLSYHWTLPDGSDRTSRSNQLSTDLPVDLAPGASTGLQAHVKSPEPGLFGNARQAYVLKWDLLNRKTGKFLSQTANVPTLDQNVAVEDPTSDRLGLENFYQYAGTATGAGSSVAVNAASGNLVFGYNALSDPGRGLASFVRLTYNSMDTSNSYVGPGWSLSASTLPRLGTPLQFEFGLPGLLGYPSTVTVVDGDGTSHAFSLNKHGSNDPKNWDYDKPAGVHLFLQRTSSDNPDRAWVMTAPDRTQFFFDRDGFQTSTVDKNNDVLTYQYTRTVIGNRNTGVLKTITDPAGRQSLTFDYYRPGQDFAYFLGNVKLFGSNLTNGLIINQLASVTDLSGRRIAFTYSDKGLLQEISDAAGTPQEKDFDFFYDDGTLLTNPKLIRVNDPLGHGTQISYYDDHAGDLRERRVRDMTDRVGAVTGFDYAAVDPKSGNALRETVTDPNGYATNFTVDHFGRPVSFVNAKSQTTDMSWDADNNVVRLQENNKAAATWSYDPGTGYPLEITDPEQNAHGGASTGLTYRTSLNGHVADLIEKVSPEGRKWTFGYDQSGNLTSVTDPNGNAPGVSPGHFTTKYTYDNAGQLVTATDANGHTATYGDYDPTGYPKAITDALGNVSRSTYDVVGDVVSTTDANQKTSTYTYDIFKRPLDSKVPKDAAKQQYIVTPGPLYDKNDNVVQVTAPNGALGTATYDADDRLVSSTATKDTLSGPARITTHTYDRNGNELSVTTPNGNLTPNDPNDFTTHYTYDEIDQVLSSVDAGGNKTSYGYDDVGNSVQVVDPLKNATPDPADFTAKYGYDLNHRGTTVTDAAGHTKSTEYDRDGMVVATSDEDGNKTLSTLDARGATVEVKVPHRNDSGTVIYNTTRYEYDESGNNTKRITPRGVASGAVNTFEWETRYDELNRVKAQLSAFDPNDSQYNTPSETDYFYDPVGQLSKVSAPPSQRQTVRNDTTYSYFDNGWAQSSKDPWNIVTSYDYTDLGQQSARTVSSAGGALSRTMSWQYYPDGKIKRRTDTGIPAGTAVELVDNSDAQNVSAVGAWPASGTGGGFEGFDYQTHPAGISTDSFGWNLTMPLDGSYQVFVQFPAVAGAATDASYNVDFHGGSATATVDQTKNAGQWVSLGSFDFAADDTTQKVTLGVSAGGTVVADAVRLVRNNSPTAADTQQIDFSYSYDASSNLVDLSDQSSGARFDDYAATFDGLNRLAKLEVKKSGTAQHTTGFIYDADGNTVTRTDDAATGKFDYDVRNLLAKVTDSESASDPKPKVTTFGYTTSGQVERENRANGNTVDYTYFLDGALQHQLEKKSDGTAVAEHTLDYDQNGNRTKDVERTQNADNHSAYLNRTTTNNFDPLDRLASVNKSDGGSESYVHDANSNVISQTAGGSTTTSNYNRNRLQTTVSGGFTSVYNYDPFGRLDTVGVGGNIVARYNYDGFDRISSEKKKAGSAFTTTNYVHDPFDRVVSQTTNAGSSTEKTTTFDYLSLSRAVVAEQENGKTTKTYQYSPWGERLSQVVHKQDGSEEPTYYSYNPHSDVQAVTDDNGDTKSTYGYTAYGASDDSQNTGVDKQDPANPTKEPYNAYRFNADRFDAATGNYDMGFRSYDPGLNQFLTRDLYNGALADLGMTANPFTSNRYAFGGGNPLSNIELTGHGWLSDLGHAALDVAGMIPVVGAVADVANGVWYAAEGDYLDAGLSFAGAIPVIGDAAIGARYAVKGAKYAGEAIEGGEALIKGAKGVEHAAQDVKAADRAAEEAAAAEKAATQKAAQEAAAKKAAEEAAAKKAAEEAAARRAAEAQAEARAEAKAESAAESKAASACNSFPGDTPVLMGNGVTKPISEVQAGDRVEATDTLTGQTRAESVTKHITTLDDADFTDTTVRAATGQRTVTSTQHHLFWDTDHKRWVEADSLKPGDQLREPDGTSTTVVSVRNYHLNVATYDLTVEDFHTYYVGAGVLVHNCGKNQGVYLFRDEANPGNFYVGKTNDFNRRIGEHMRDGRVSNPKCVLKIHVCGGDDELFAAEDELMSRLRSHGVPLSNKSTSPGAKIRARQGDQLTLFDLP
jgi:RHS repeat-associated protein